MKRWIVFIFLVWCAASVLGQGDNGLQNHVPHPQIDIEVHVKDWNWDADPVWCDADDPHGPYIIPGDSALFKFIVTNIGNVPLTGVVVCYTREESDMGGPDYGYMDPGDVWVMEHLEETPVTLGQHKDFGYVVGRYNGMIVYDNDRVCYFGAYPPPQPAPQLNRPMAGIAGEALPVSFDLSQNYPNPFNPTTTIGYDLPYETRVNIRIYDILGSEVITLVDGEMQAGRHAIVWNATDRYGKCVSSGIYFYTIHTPDFQKTRRLMLLR